MRSSLLTFGFALVMALPSYAQLAGTDLAPGDSCAGTATGAMAISADADGDGGSITLICDGTNWVEEANFIQAGFSRIAVEGNPCTIVDQLAYSAANDLLVCKNVTALSGELCGSFKVGAVSFDDDGAMHVCLN